MKMRFVNYWTTSALAVGLICSPGMWAQTNLNSLSSVVSVVAPEKITAKRGATQNVDFTIQVKSGYHVNSNTPSDEFLIPLKFTFVSDGPVEVTGVEYPKPTFEKLDFSTKPVSVFQGDIRATARIRTGVNPRAGLSHITGKLHYQACSTRVCLPPRTLEVKVPVEIRN